VNKILALCLGLSLLALTKPVCAQTDIKQIPIDVQMQMPLDLYLYQGQGTTITFGKVGQRIKTIWIDNKQSVVVNTNGCLPGLGANKCQKSDATAIHLKANEAHIGRIETNNRSQLTVETTNPSNQSSFYVYNIFAYPNTTRVEAIKLLEYTNFSNLNVVAKITQKLDRSIEQGLISDPLLIERTRTLIDAVKNGSSIEEAAKVIKLSPRYVNGLIN
jgi:hypothetical protein